MAAIFTQWELRLELKFVKSHNGKAVKRVSSEKMFVYLRVSAFVAKFGVVFHHHFLVPFPEIKESGIWQTKQKSRKQGL